MRHLVAIGLTWFAVIFIGLLALPLLIDNIDVALKYSQVFQNLCIGLGAVLAGSAGLKIIPEIFDTLKRRELLLKYKKEYPLKNLNKTYALIQSEDAIGKIYLYDMNSLEKRWIASLSTLHSLDFNHTDVTTMDKHQFSKIRTGERILISGNPGS